MKGRGMSYDKRMKRSFKDKEIDRLTVRVQTSLDCRRNRMYLAAAWVAAAA